MIKIKNFKIVKHPIIEHNLSIIRDKNTSCESFRNSIQKIAYALILSASEDLPIVEKEVETPIKKTTCKVFDNSCQIIVAPILRAGMIFLQAAVDILPFANVHHIGMYRDEKTLEPIWYYDKKKEILKDKAKVKVLILDPMLATGNSAVDAITNFLNKGIKEKNITFVSLVCAPVGVNKINKKYPGVKIITASLDECLNDKGYIVPGLGDAGDRIYNT